MIDWLKSSLGVPPILEELNILYENSGDPAEYMSRDALEEIFMDRLQRDDETFGSMYTSGRFPCLRRINIMCAVLHLSDMISDILESYLPSLLPFIHGTGMLVLQVAHYRDRDQFMKDASIIYRQEEGLARNEGEY